MQCSTAPPPALSPARWAAPAAGSIGSPPGLQPTFPGQGSGTPGWRVGQAGLLLEPPWGVRPARRHGGPVCNLHRSWQSTRWRLPPLCSCSSFR